MAQPIWNTPSGSIGSYPSGNPLKPVVFPLSASAVLPAVTVTYQIISGSLPDGLTMTVNGLISGVPTAIVATTTYTFVVRATDNLQNIRDNTFTISISGISHPRFTTTPGPIPNPSPWSSMYPNSFLDSTWIEIPIEYDNPIADNPVIIRVIAGNLPPGIEINDYGLIRGYSQPPVTNVNLPPVSTVATAVSSNVITCLNTGNFTVGRPVIFTGDSFGGIVPNQTYYVAAVIDGTSFTVSTTMNGPVQGFTDDAGYMPVSLPTVTQGQPTSETFNFFLKLESALGSDIQSYSISVVNQNTPVQQGGPGYGQHTRVPTLYNTRPETFQLDRNITEFGYYVLPPDGKGATYPLNQPAFIGTITSDNRLDFSILGHDFDGDDLQYTFLNLPLGLSGNSSTGWVTGNPVISPNTASSFSFSVYATKVVFGTVTNIVTPTITFSFKIITNINGDIVWISPADLGTVLNGLPSMAYVKATSDVDLLYRVTSGTLPPNLTLLPTGELSGIVAFQPGTTFQNPDTTSVFTFTVQAYSTQFASVSSSQTFTLSVYQEFNNPTDILYIKCTPSISDRNLLATLLNNDTLIPPDYLYRADDPFFGKATSVIYEHAYGINASSIDQYLAAITKNHYWRQLTLGEIKTAVARNDETGEILYEVVYSEVYDNLVAYGEADGQYELESQSNIITPQGESVAKEVYWPRLIPLFLGPWYDSEDTIFTSWGNTPDGQSLYTSRTPGFVRTVYPNSLPNMRQQVVDVLGQTQDYKILPLWMTSQQRNGSTLGFTPAWVIAYCKPGVTTLPDGTEGSYAQYIQYQIQNNWVNAPGELQTLNTVNFKIDRFSVNKSATYNYDNNLSPPAWTSIPSAAPTPNPIDSKDFYVLFEQETILPGTTQY
jgi:Putative Ig domain